MKCPTDFFLCRKIYDKKWNHALSARGENTTFGHPTLGRSLLSRWQPNNELIQDDASRAPTVNQTAEDPLLFASIRRVDFYYNLRAFLGQFWSLIHRIRAKIRS
jgi:hypothetical protein